MKQAIAVLVAISCAAFAFIFGNEADELSVIDLGIMFVTLALILGLQVILLAGIHRLFRMMRAADGGELAAKLAAAALAGSNAYFLAFITFQVVFEMKVALSVAVAIAALGVLLVRRWQGFALFVLSAYFTLSLGLYAYTRFAMTGDDVAQAPITVRSARNVYFIGNESLPSPRAYREIYGVTELPHVNFLRSRGFRVLDQAYSADYSTLQNYARVLDFGNDLSRREIWRRAPFRSANSTFSSFSSSGYQTQFLYHVTYFGLDPDLVDYTYPEISFAHCEFSPQSFFYVLCRDEVHSNINRILFDVDFDIEIALDRIRAAASADEPWITFYHHNYPFHSEAIHSFDDAAELASFRDEIRASTHQILSRGMEAVVSTIQQEDPDAVIILFGDHGAVSSRGSDLDAPQTPFSSAEIFQDRYGVMLAVYPQDFCTNRIGEGSTTLHLVENVIECLNGDDTPTPVETVEGRTFYWEGEQRDAARYASLPVSADGRGGMAR